jgi:hypothetical protein
MCRTWFVQENCLDLDWEPLVLSLINNYGTSAAALEMNERKMARTKMNNFNRRVID